MSEGKSTISKASSYQEIGEYWDKHKLSDSWKQTKPVESDIDIQRISVRRSDAPRKKCLKLVSCL